MRRRVRRHQPYSLSSVLGWLLGRGCGGEAYAHSVGRASIESHYAGKNTWPGTLALQPPSTDEAFFLLPLVLQYKYSVQVPQQGIRHTHTWALLQAEAVVLHYEYASCREADSQCPRLVLHCTSVPFQQTWTLVTSGSVRVVVGSDTRQRTQPGHTRLAWPTSVGHLHRLTDHPITAVVGGAGYLQASRDAVDTALCAWLGDCRIEYPKWNWHSTRASLCETAACVQSREPASGTTGCTTPERVRVRRHQPWTAWSGQATYRRARCNDVPEPDPGSPWL